MAQTKGKRDAVFVEKPYATPWSKYEKDIREDIPNAKRNYNLMQHSYTTLWSTTTPQYETV